MSMQIVECTLARQRRRRDANTTSVSGQVASVAAGRVPRIARLMALALRFEELVRSGAIRDYAELARLGQVSRARITQVMNLLHLAPDLQEEILFLPRVHSGRDGFHLDELQALTALVDWQEQRRRWNTMRGTTT
jgi:hypothetical protein